MAKILITGASGFVGRALCPHLAKAGYEVSACVRQHAALEAEWTAQGRVSLCETGEVNPHTDWREWLTDVEAIVHLAARVHVMRDDTGNRLQHYREANTQTTLNLARQAAESGVRRFVFVSTVKVLGEGKDEPYRESDIPGPVDDYALSKWEAEQGLHAISAETGMEVVILRPPLVYGPGVKANFLRLMQWVERGWPLPLGAVKNRRSLIYLGNFISAITVCLEHPAAAGKTFLVSDGEDVSTPDLICLIANEIGHTARLLPVPLGLIQTLARMAGKQKEVERLLGSLSVDGRLIKQTCNWLPPFSLQEGIRNTVQAYLASLPKQ